MPLKAPLLITRPLIVLTDVAPLIAPLKARVLMPLRAPAVVTVKPVDWTLKLPRVLPIAVLAVPVVLIAVVPVAVRPPLMFAPALRVVSPATFSVPPRLVAPVPTVKVEVPETLVLPFKDTAPVPVLKLPDPL